MKRWHTAVLGVLISIAALFFAFRQADVEAIAAAFQNARYEYIALGGLLILFTTGLRGLRWRVLTDGRISAIDGFWLFNIGFLFNNVLPVRLGEFARAALAGRRSRMHFTSALSSIVVERLFDMVSVVVMLGMVFVLLENLPGWTTTAGAVMGGIALAGIVGLAFAARQPDGALTLAARLLAILPRISREQASRFLRPFVDGLAGVSDWRVFAGGMLLSLLAWLASALAGWVLMLAFWPDPSPVAAILAVAAAGLGIAVPAAPSGVGPFEAAVIAALIAIGYNADLSRSFALALHAANFVMTSGIGLLGLMREGMSFSEVARAAESVGEKK
jgi:uncharacterized protein (TIRG00374 family)